MSELISTVWFLKRWKQCDFLHLEQRVYLLNARNVVDSQFLEGELKLLVICCSCPVNNLLLSACWPLQAQHWALIQIVIQKNGQHFLTFTTPHLAANADLRLQFGKLLLIHYQLLHLKKHTSKNIVTLSVFLQNSFKNITWHMSGRPTGKMGWSLEIWIHNRPLWLTS